MPRRDWRLRVHDILKAVERIEKFTRGLTLEKFIEDDRTIAAVSYELVVIGERRRRFRTPFRPPLPTCRGGS